MKKLILATIFGLGLSFCGDACGMHKRMHIDRSSSSCSTSGIPEVTYNQYTPRKVMSTKQQDGMYKYSANNKYSSSSRTVEILANTYMQNTREKTAIREQDTATMQMLINELKEIKNQMREEKKQHKEEKDQYKKEKDQLMERIAQLMEQNEIERAKVAALERANKLAEDANRITKERNQQIVAMENARINRINWLMGEINWRRRRIEFLESTYIRMDNPARKPPQCNYGFGPQNPGYIEFCKEKKKAKVNISRLKGEIRTLECQLKPV